MAFVNILAHLYILRRRAAGIKIPDSVRDYVFQRDRYQCQSCGRQQGEVNLQVDHIISLAQGGSNDLSNLQTLCQACNRRKSSNHDSRFRRHFT